MCVCVFFPTVTRERESERRRDLEREESERENSIYTGLGRISPLFHTQGVCVLVLSLYARETAVGVQRTLSCSYLLSLRYSNESEIEIDRESEIERVI